MAKPEWGAKRTCQSCGTRFYDMQRTPLICPKCGATVEPEVVFKPRRQSAASQAAKAKEAAINPVREPEEAEPAEEDEAELDTMEGAEDDDSGLIEDASDLGEDDDDMAEVMEHLDDGLEDEG
ncbi:protein of unknown function (FYDLN_acid) [mine drainage metagenome]|uniref:TIGR02300 family protein n=1 Tax=mine drainage metagenome TaxID=410659 RepID=A0A1J5RRI1_9ZZZZ